MAQLDFYATDQDFHALLKFVADNTDIRLFEAYSRIDHDIREFRDIRHLVESDHIANNQGRFFLRGWSPSVVTEQKIREISLKPEVGKFRSCVEGPAVIQFLQEPNRESRDIRLYWSTISHWNEAGAYQRSTYSERELDAVDWKMQRRISGQIHRHIRNKLAVAKIGPRPVLEGAYGVLVSGGKIWVGPGEVSISSDRLELIGSRRGAA